MTMNKSGFWREEGGERGVRGGAGGEKKRRISM
jgi:hypothetical protein